MRKSLKIPKDVIKRSKKPDNAMVKSTTEQAMIYKRLHREKKDRATLKPPKTAGEGSGRVNTSCSTNNTCCVTHVKNSAIGYIL